MQSQQITPSTGLDGSYAGLIVHEGLGGGVEDKEQESIRIARKDSHGGWVGPRLDAEEVPSRRANEGLVDDFLKSQRERTSFSLDTGAQSSQDLAASTTPQKHLEHSAPMTRHFERKPLLARRSYSQMLLVGVKKKILNREPLAFSETQDVALPWVFGGFSKDSWLRYQCYRLYTNDAWRCWNFLLIIVNCAAVAILPGLEDGGTLGGSWTQRDWWDLFDLVCLFFLMVEIFVGVVALGFSSANTSWINCVDYHRLELVVFVLAVLENLLAAFSIRTITFIPFRLLRIFHVLTVAKPLSGVRVMLQTLLQGAAQLSTVFATFLAITATFAIVGMAIFQRSFRRRCVLIDAAPTPDYDPSTDSWLGSEGVVITGGYPFHQGCKIVYNTSDGDWDDDYPLDPYGRYHTCQLSEYEQGFEINQMCEDIGNPEVSFGFGSFDHLGTSMLVLFQTSLPDNFYDVFHISLQTEPNTIWLTWLYYFSITGISTCLMLGLFVAVVTGTFKRVKEAGQYRDTQLKTLKLPNTVRNAPQLSLGSLGPPSKTTPSNADLSSWDTSRDGPLSPERPPAGQAGAALPEALEDFKGGVSLFVSAQASPLGPDLVSDHRDNRWKREVTKWTSGTPMYVLDGVVNAVVIVHCATLASDQYDSSTEWRRLVEWVYVGCSAVYVVEVVLHAAALHSLAGRRGLRSKRLWFKIALCVLGIVGWAADMEVLKRSQAIWMYKIMRLLPALELLVSLTVASMEHVLSVCLFVCIWALVYAITGRYVIGSEMDEITRSNFGTLGRALLTVFQLFTGDSWSGVMYSAIESMPNILGRLMAALFVLSWVMLSQFLLNNLFVAVIIDKFKVSEVISEQLKLDQERSVMARVRAHAQRFWSKLYRKANWTAPPPLVQSHNRSCEDADLVRSFSGPASSVRSTRVADEATLEALTSRQRSGLARSVTTSAEGRLAMLTSSSAHQMSSVAMFNHLIDYSTTGQMISAISAVSSVHDSHILEHPEAEADRVLFLFGLEHPARRLCTWLGKTKGFDAVIIVAIVCSCLLLIITPRNDDIPGWNHVLSPEAIQQWSLGFTVLFTLEFIVRVMRHGLLFTPDAYLKSWWNQADLLILIFAWVDETQVLPSNGLSKFFRLGRAFRPLRLMKRNKGMRVLVDALIHALVPVSYVFVFSVFTSVIFGLIGMGLGPFPSSQEGSGVMLPRSWVNADHNFDTIWDACPTLLQVATLKYVRVLFLSMDVTSVGLSPLEDSSPAAALFFVAFIVCGRLFVYNLFVAFIVDGFYASRGSSQTSIAFGRLMRQLKIHKPPREDYRVWSNKLSVWLRGVVQHRYFQTWSVVCVVVNVVLMLTDHADPTEAFEALMWWQNLIFFVELCIENLMQIIAYGPPAFVQDKWRLFDLAVAVGTASGYISSHREVAHFAKSFRLARALRFMTLIHPVRIIFETLIACLPQLFNIFLLVVLVYSIFAAVAVQLFGVTKYGMRLGPTANFDTWSHAMQTCYQMLTGDEWMDLRSDCEVQAPACTVQFSAEYVEGWEGADLSFGDCGVRTAYLYFIAFKIFCEAVLLNLVIGMALDNFTFVTDDVSHEEDATWANGASSDQVRQLATVFRRFDRGTGSIPLSFLPSLIHELPRPLGLKESILSKHQQTPTGDVDPTGSRAPLNSARSEQRRRLMSPQVAEDKAMLRKIRAELNCLVRDRRLAGEGQRTLWDQWTKQGHLTRLVEWVRGFVGWKKRFKEAVSFEEVMRTIVMWRLPELVPSEVHQWRRRWVMDDIMQMVRILAVRDWLVLRARIKQKARETREKQAEAARVACEQAEADAGAQDRGGKAGPVVHATASLGIDDATLESFRDTSLAK